MYYLGIDIGGTMTKAGLYTRDGKEIMVSEKSSDGITPHPGWVERDLNDFWESICFCIRDCVKKAGVDNSEVKGVGFSAHGKGLYPIDKDGEPVRNGIISSDTRATALVKEWMKKGIHKEAYPFGRQQLWTAHPVALLAWMKENEPDNYQKIDTIFMAHDYIRFKMSGEKRAEITNISGSNAYNIEKGTYDEKMLALFGIQESLSCFPPVVSSFEQAGRVTAAAANATGLAEGTPLFGGFFDVVGGAMASGITDEETLNVIAGTWAITTRITDRVINKDYPYIWGNYSLENTYFVHEGTPTSASNLQWFVDRFMQDEEDVFTTCNRWFDELADEPSEIIFLPYLYGSNVSLDLNSCFYGLQAHHEKKHMVKAIYEGVVLSYLIHHERIMQFEPDIKNIRFTGGPTRSIAWMQLFCDATGLPLEVIDLKQPGCSSAALCAIAGTHEETPVTTLLEEFQAPVTPYQPDMIQHKQIQTLFEKYKILAYGLADISQKLEAIG